MAVLAWSPLCGGALTGKYLEGTPDNSRFALFPDRYPRYNTARVKRATEKYAKIAHEVGCSPSQLAIAYCRCAPRRAALVPMEPACIVAAFHVGATRTFALWRQGRSAACTGANAQQTACVTAALLR